MQGLKCSGRQFPGNSKLCGSDLAFSHLLFASALASKLAGNFKAGASAFSITMSHLPLGLRIAVCDKLNHLQAGFVWYNLNQGTWTDVLGCGSPAAALMAGFHAVH
jgi:hypothetical protein